MNPQNNSEQIRNKQATILKDIDHLLKSGDEITVINYQHDFGGYTIKDKFGCMHYVYRKDFELKP